MDPMDARNGNGWQPDERWQQGSPLKRAKMEYDSGEAENSVESPGSDDSSRRNYQRPFYTPPGDAGRTTPGRRRPAFQLDSLDAAREIAWNRLDAMDDGLPNSARSTDSNVSASSALDYADSSPRSTSSLSGLMRDITLEDDEEPRSGSASSSKREAGSQKPKKKRVRRTATEIERNWKCELCGKGYGSEGALKTHVKLKHPGFKVPKREEIITGQGVGRFLNQRDGAGGAAPGPYLGSVNANEQSGRRSHSLPTPKRVRVKDAAATPAMSIKMEDASSFSSSSPSSPGTGTGTGLTPVTSPGGTTLKPNPDAAERERTSAATPGSLFVPALTYKCGDYERHSTYCGDLVLAINLGDRKLAWDNLSANSLLRMEISFDDISSVGVEPQGATSNSFLLIQLAKPPTFYCGWSDPHHAPTVWVRVNDFTGNSAIKWRHHVFSFLTTALQEPLNRLFEVDPRIAAMAQQGLAENEALKFSDEVTMEASIAIPPSQAPGAPIAPSSPLSPMSPASPYSNMQIEAVPSSPAALAPLTPIPAVAAAAGPAPVPAPMPVAKPANRVALSNLNKQQRRMLLKPSGGSSSSQTHHIMANSAAFAQAPPPSAQFPELPLAPSPYQQFYPVGGQRYAQPQQQQTHLPHSQQHHGQMGGGAHFMEADDDSESGMDWTGMESPLITPALARSHSMPMRTDFLGANYPHPPLPFGAPADSGNHLLHQMNNEMFNSSLAGALDGASAPALASFSPPPPHQQPPSPFGGIASPPPANAAMWPAVSLPPEFMDGIVEEIGYSNYHHQ